MRTITPMLAAMKPAGAPTKAGTFDHTKAPAAYNCFLIWKKMLGAEQAGPVEEGLDATGDATGRSLEVLP